MKYLKLIVVLALAAAVTGCTSKPQIEYVYIAPECEPPVTPAFQPWDWDDLTLPFNHIPSDHPDWQTFDRALDDVERHENELVDYTLELQAGYAELCSTEKIE